MFKPPQLPGFISAIADHSAIACILLAYALHPDAALYVSTDSAGTYITRSGWVLANTLLPKVGGVVALQVNDVRLLQLLKALPGMFVTFGPKSTVVSDRQFWKVPDLPYNPNETIDGRSMYAKLLQLLKELDPMLVAFGKSTYAKLPQLEKELDPVLVAFGKSMYAKLPQPEKAESPIVVAFGTLTYVSPVQLLKALDPMLVTFGRSMYVSRDITDVPLTE